MAFQGNAIGSSGGVVQQSFPNQQGTALPGTPYSSADVSLIDSAIITGTASVVAGRGVVLSAISSAVATVTAVPLTLSTSNTTTAITNITAGYLMITGVTPTPMFLANVSFAATTNIASVVALLNAMTGIGTGVWSSINAGASAATLVFTTTSTGPINPTVTDLNTAGASTGLAAALGLTTATLTVVQGNQGAIRPGISNEGVRAPTTGDSACYGVALRALSGFTATTATPIWPVNSNAPIMRQARAGGRVNVESFTANTVNQAAYMVTVADTCTAGTSYHPVGSFTNTATPVGATTAAGYAAGTAVACGVFRSTGLAGTPVVGGDAIPNGTVVLEFGAAVAAGV